MGYIVYYVIYLNRSSKQSIRLAKRSTSNQISGQDIFNHAAVDISKTVLTPPKVVEKAIKLVWSAPQVLWSPVIVD